MRVASPPSAHSPHAHSAGCILAKLLTLLLRFCAKRVVSVPQTRHSHWRRRDAAAHRQRTGAIADPRERCGERGRTASPKRGARQRPRGRTERTFVLRYARVTVSVTVVSHRSTAVSHRAREETAQSIRTDSARRRPFAVRCAASKTRERHAAAAHTRGAAGVWVSSRAEAGMVSSAHAASAE